MSNLFCYGRNDCEEGCYSGKHGGKSINEEKMQSYIIFEGILSGQTVDVSNSFFSFSSVSR